jgi:putative aldouronate transport system substrate-binding protein
MKKILSLVLALAVVLSMVGLVSAESALPFEKGTVLRMAVGYNNSKTGLRFDPEVAKEGLTLADGKTYHSGDFKPTWVAVQELLGFTIEDKYQGQSSTKEFEYWKEQLDQVDMLSGTAAQLSENGEAGLLVNIAEYLDQMPNFKAYLDENPIVKLSITGNVENGAIYFSPYFDGVNDIEKMPLMRVDWVQKLLDGEGEFTADACNNTAAPVYTPYMPTEGKIEIETPNLEGTATETVTKDYNAYGNIVAKMNEKGSMTGVEAVNMLREYIDKTYGGYYGTARSNLFMGQNAAWDADELVALLRCVVANPQTLNGTDKVEGLFSREENNTARRADVYRFAGMLFGVRGLESRQDFLFVGLDNMLHDARQEAATYEAMGRMNTLVQEGLISTAFVNREEVKTENYLEQDLGFMHYDYNQTQTVYNETKLDKEAGEKYMAVMIPVARWEDGTEGGNYMRFTESWRSVKSDGWGISKAGVGNDTNKLNAALSLIDYAYSPEGTIMMSYGPEAFRKEGETFLFNGKEMPVIADATWKELWSIPTPGNYTNYARQYLGSTLSFMKSQAFEFQCTCEAGKEGAGKISTAIGLGTIKHPLLEIAENPWYTSMPTVLPTTKEDNQALGNLTDLTEKFGTASASENVLVNMIISGFTLDGMTSAEGAAEYVKDTMGGAQYLDIKELAWEDLLDYYASIK